MIYLLSFFFSAFSYDKIIDFSRVVQRGWKQPINWKENCTKQTKLLMCVNGTKERGAMLCTDGSARRLKGICQAQWSCGSQGTRQWLRCSHTYTGIFTLFFWKPVKNLLLVFSHTIWISRSDVARYEVGTGPQNCQTTMSGCHVESSGNGSGRLWGEGLANWGNKWSVI